jgi:hypothetical protein
MEILERKLKLQQSNFNSNAQRTSMNSRSEFYYVYGKALVNGVFKMAVLGAYSSESEANEIGQSKFPNGYDIHVSRSRDKSRATSEIKAKMLNGNHNINDVMGRVSHNI